MGREGAVFQHLLALFGQLAAEKNELGLAATCAAFGALLPQWWYRMLSPWPADLGAGGVRPLKGKCVTGEAQIAVLEDRGSEVTT